MKWGIYTLLKDQKYKIKLMFMLYQSVGAKYASIYNECE